MRSGSNWLFLPQTGTFTSICLFFGLEGLNSSEGKSGQASAGGVPKEPTHYCGVNMDSFNMDVFAYLSKPVKWYPFVRSIQLKVA